MNNTAITILLVSVGAFISLISVAFGVWIVAKLTGAFKTYDTVQVVDNLAVSGMDMTEPEVPERVPWEDEEIPPDGDPGEDPDKWEAA